MQQTSLILGSPLPPPHSYKLQVIKHYSNMLNLRLLIETGTYLGETISHCINAFKEIHSIEISNDLFQKAEQKFKHEINVFLYMGDSAKVLPELLKSINVPSIFWLDGHYSAGITAKGKKNTPIIEELDSILAHPLEDHVILIDDARCFIGEEDYPTLFELKEFIEERKPQFQIKLKHDIIRIGKNLNKVDNI